MMEICCCYCPGCLCLLVPKKRRMELDSLDVHPVIWKQPANQNLVWLRFSVLCCLQSSMNCSGSFTLPECLESCPTLNWSQVNEEDAEEDGDNEEDPPCEGRCDVHDATAGAVLCAALCPAGEEAANHSIGKGRFDQILKGIVQIQEYLSSY